MKKTFFYILTVFLIIFCTGCSMNPLVSFFQGKKKSENYYTQSMINDIKKYDIKGITVLETNLQKEKKLDKDDIALFCNFLSSLKAANFKGSFQDKKPPYKFFVETNNSKYVINIYDEKNICLFPWDGIYDTDKIDMTDVKKLYNLYDLCTYWFSKNQY